MHSNINSYGTIYTLDSLIRLNTVMNTNRKLQKSNNQNTVVAQVVKFINPFQIWSKSPNIALIT